MNQADVSIILPFFNEEESVRTVVDEIRGLYPDAEIVAVDDGSMDHTPEILAGIAGVKVVRFPKNRGQSAAMYVGLRAASRAICVLMDGDGQNDPADIPKLVALLDGAGLVCGFRAHRKDTASRRWASKAANRIRRWFIHDGVRDTGCSLKAMRREAAEHLIPFNGMHRYIPAMLKASGLVIAEVAVNHRARGAGVSKYTNWDRALRGIHDLIGVSWILKRKVDATLPKDPA
jgi:dolichol-phosphate mannosyltransferase